MMTTHELRVYPRVCGETCSPVSQVLLLEGLSPRVRGNHLVQVYLVAAGGSIPACAGKPPGKVL